MKPRTPKHQSITFLLAIEKNTENGEIESDQTARERVLANIAIKAPFISKRARIKKPLSHVQRFFFLAL